jgi:hypothetical protein
VPSPEMGVIPIDEKEKLRPGGRIKTGPSTKRRRNSATRAFCSTSRLASRPRISGPPYDSAAASTSFGGRMPADGSISFPRSSAGLIRCVQPGAYSSSRIP